MRRRFVQTRDGIRKTWYVERIWRLAEALPVEEIPLERIRGLDEVTWFWAESEPTVRRVAEHCRRILACDLSWPVILTEDDCVFDGMHRLARHLMEGRTTVAVKRFPRNPEPDETDVLETSPAARVGE